MGTLHHIRTPPEASERERSGDPNAPEVIEACRRGDREALGLVLRAHADYLERLLIRVAGPSLAPDLLQMTMMAAIHAFPRFRGEAQVRTWLARIAVRTARGELRRAHRRRRARGDPGDPSDNLHSVSPLETPEQHTTNEQALRRVQHHLEAIGPKKRIAFILHVLEGHSMDEVAALMDASVSATKSRVFWARKELLARSRRDPLLSDLVASFEEKT